MHSDGKTYYPTRSFIRFQAKNQLIAELMKGQELTVVSRLRELGVAPILESKPDDEDGSAKSLNDSKPLATSGLNTSATTPFSVDEELFAEISSTAFHSEHHPELYQGTSSQQDVMAIERAIANEIVSAYQRILNNRTDKDIQNLNALL
ncbi:MAG: hypothetical protein AAF327_16580 [Cyanobacteria bacterium P01_A01_bin.37]